MTDCEVLDADTAGLNQPKRPPVPSVKAVTGATTQGPSFDCSKAANTVENLICSDKELSELEWMVAGAFKRALDNQADRASLIAQQRQFNIVRNNCAKEAPSEVHACVQQLLGSRAMYLSTLWRHESSSATPAPTETPAAKPIDAAIAAQSSNRNGIVSTNYEDGPKNAAAQTDSSISPVAILVLIGLFLYFLPSIIAVNRGHHNALAISALNLFLGWSFLGWVIAFVWACTRVETRGMASQVDVLTARREPQI